jgi:hypothetical protein
MKHNLIKAYLISICLIIFVLFFILSLNDFYFYPIKVSNQYLINNNDTILILDNKDGKIKYKLDNIIIYKNNIKLLKGI